MLHRKHAENRSGGRRHKLRKHTPQSSETRVASYERTEKNFRPKTLNNWDPAPYELSIIVIAAPSKTAQYINS